MLLSAVASAQNPAPVGNLYGIALDEQGKFLRDVAVTLSGPGATQTAVTDARGDFRFLNLSPGAYSLALELTGFATVQRDVRVSLGGNEVLTITMPIATATETVAVRGESPTLDRRKTETGVTFERKELDTIPTTRDPWAILRQVPGVLLGNMNVTGSDSGTQSLFVGKGSHFDQNTYNLDGVAITNMASTGGTGLYFDFDSLEYIEVVTGGSDPSLATPGVMLNLVTRRGTNELKGSARLFYTGAGWDYGLEAGGPLWKDHLWLWGAGARNDVPGVTSVNQEGQPVRGKTDLQHWNVKLNAQPVPENTLTLYYIHFNKTVDGKNADPIHSQEATWNQTTPTTAFKVDDSHVLSERLFASIYLSYLGGDFTLTPQGGLDVQADYVDPGVWHNSYLYYRSRSPQHQAGATVSGFFDTGDLRHELKFGFGYKHTRIDSLTAWPGDGLWGNEPSSLAVLTRNANYTFEMNYYDTHIGDTIHTGNLTVNVGARFDYQQGKNLPSSVPANPVFPDLLPAVEYGGDAGYPITWRLFQPRIGATYAVGRDRKTLLRASYSRFTNQLGSEVVNINAFPALPAYLYYAWNDTNGNHRVDKDEVDLTYPEGFARVNPNNPGSSAPVNQLARDLKAPKTDEFIVGVEREIMSDLSASISYTHRSAHDLEFQPLVGVTSADYQLIGNASGSVTDAQGFTLDFNEPYYGLTKNPTPVGLEIRNRPDYRETYDGVELQIVKRLSHRWMLRASFAYNDWRKHVGAGAIVDPNNLRGGSNASGEVVEPAGGSFGPSGSFINSKWQFNVSGTVQLPLGLEAAANFFGRQGFPTVYFVRAATHANTTDPTPRIQIGQVGTYRNSDVYELDLHLEKTFRIGSRVTATPSMDCFNVVNSHTVLQRIGSVGVWDLQADPVFTPKRDFNQPAEQLGDRTFRGGVRISF